MGEVAEALTRACHADCVTRGAILESLERGVVTAPNIAGGWLVRKESDGLALYVLAGRAVSVARGACVHHQGEAHFDSHAEASVAIVRTPFRDDARIECRVERIEQRSGGQMRPHTVLRWRFGSGGFELPVEIEPDSEDARRRAEAEQAEWFTRAVALVLAQ